MYEAFNVELKEKWATDKIDVLKAHYDVEKKSYSEELKKLIDSSTTISADEIKKLLLPEQSFDVFISHSHADLDLALGLKFILKSKFNLNAFVDELYWGNIDTLQDELNKRHLHKENGMNLYDHNQTMQVAAHANMILASALTGMIDKCECVFFLNTENSVQSANDVLKGVNTRSPWIYHEVYTTTVIQRHYDRGTNKRFAAVNESLKDSLMPTIEYPLDISKMKPINDGIIREWFHKKTSMPNAHSLDVLYSIYEKLS